MASHALQASAIEAKIENARPLAGTIARKNEAHGTQAYPELMMSRGINAAAPSLRGPLPDGMTGPTTCGVVAMVIASEDFIHEREIADVAWLRGMGWATEPSFPRRPRPVASSRLGRRRGASLWRCKDQEAGR